MSNPIPSTPKPTTTTVADLLLIINKVIIKAFSVESKEAFQFIMLNDTIHVIKYDRAVLWSFDDRGLAKLQGISGQSTFNKNAPQIKKWEKLVSQLHALDEACELKEEHFSDHTAWREFLGSSSKILWLPIIKKSKVGWGLWLELGPDFADKTIHKDFLALLQSTLITGYAAVYSRFGTAWEHVSIGLKKKWVRNTVLALLLILLIVRIPIRIAAPCEVVAQDPFIVTAPLEGIIKEILVKPGQQVKPDQILAEYDKRVALQNLKAAKKQVQVSQSLVDRSETLGLSDANALSELSVLTLKLQKDKISLDLAEYQTSLLDIKAPIAGTVIMDEPEEWRGKPVRIGEKIMILGTPEKSKVRLWIPESDNIPLDFNRAIKVILNVKPEYTYYAKLTYIANESILHDNYIPSFSADAEWEKPLPEDLKLGLKGTAILYGERVSLAYFLFRKPWLTLRNILGF